MDIIQPVLAWRDYLRRRPLHPQVLVTMKLAIDSFYFDKVYGTLKFKGYRDGKLIFDKYERSYDRWLEMGQRVNLDPEFQSKRANAGRTRPILPPE